MKPDVSDAHVERRARDGRRDRRMRCDHDCLDLLWSGGQRRIAGLPADFSGARIDGEDIVSGLCEPAKYRVRGSAA